MGGGMPGFPGVPAFFGLAANGDRGIGPIRRGGGIGMGGRQPRAGPYDRQQPRQQRWGDNSGRLSPPGGMTRPRTGTAAGRGERWGDGAAGAAAVGPREAVQGRSLRSYEDLDAVAGAGGAELNY